MGERRSLSECISARAKENASRRVTHNSNCDVPWYANSDKGRTKNGCNWRAVKASGRWGNVTREAQGGCRFAYTCADRLVEATERGIRDPIAETKYSQYMISRCTHLLQYAQVSSIYLVFDGIRVPLKSGTNASRESKRQQNIVEARRLMSAGRRNEALDKYKSCVKGTEEMARVVCAAVEKEFGKDGKLGVGKKWGVGRVKCVFSPYEADAQLAKLCADGYCHGVVTEDSDVLVYSAACRRPFPSE
eukprot:scaffold465_cov149-Alexandrium_tamarense.AAC.3